MEWGINMLEVLLSKGREQGGIASRDAIRDVGEDRCFCVMEKSYVPK
jgi:hypothetical protein